MFGNESKWNKPSSGPKALIEKARNLSLKIGGALTAGGRLLPDAWDGGYPESIGMRGLVLGGVLHLIVSKEARKQVINVLKTGKEKAKDFLDKK